MKTNIRHLFLKNFLFISLIVGFSFNSFTHAQKDIPERTIMFIIDGMPSGLHEKINLPNFESLAEKGVLFEKVYLPHADHPDSSSTYPWTCSLPNPVLMTGTIFIGQDGIKQNMIQHSFKKRPTALLANAGAYYAIRHGFTYYRDLSDGKYENIFRDELSTKAAKKFILNHNPEFIRVHCQGPGSAGHRTREDTGKSYTGNIWAAGSPFIKQNQYVDSLLGDFVSWLKAEELWEESVLIVMGDHGQTTTGGHPPYKEGNDVTQMLITGPGIKEGVNYNYAEIIDIAPTIAWLHQVDMPKFSDGKILKEIKEGQKVPKQREKLLKKLNELQEEYHTLDARDKSGTVFTIEEIGSWHTSKYETDYEKFVHYQLEEFRKLKK